MREQTLLVSPVFKALGKPLQMLGVDYDYFFIEGMLAMLFFIALNNFFALLLFLPLHLVGMILTKMDPCIFRLISVRASIGATKNKRIWGCQSYVPF